MGSFKLPKLKILNTSNAMIRGTRIFLRSPAFLIATRAVRRVARDAVRTSLRLCNPLASIDFVRVFRIGSTRCQNESVPLPLRHPISSLPLALNVFVTAQDAVYSPKLASLDLTHSHVRFSSSKSAERLNTYFPRMLCHVYDKLHPMLSV